MKQRNQISHNSCIDGTMLNLFEFSAKLCLAAGATLLVANAVPGAALLGVISAYDVGHDAIETRYAQQRQQQQQPPIDPRRENDETQKSEH